MTTANKRHIGAQNETKALEYFQKQGFSFVARNIFTPYGEIDLIVERDGLVLFVEVKSRRSKTSPHGVAPEHNMTQKKLQHFFRAAAYLSPRYRGAEWGCALAIIEDNDFQWFELRADTL